MAKKRPFALTSRNMTLLIPVFLLIFLPLLLLRQIIPPPTDLTLAALLWAVIIYFASPNILILMGRCSPHFQRYLVWTQKGKA